MIYGAIVDAPTVASMGPAIENFNVLATKVHTSVTTFDEFGLYNVDRNKLQAIVDKGATPVSTIQPNDATTTLASINNGTHDAWIDTYATMLATFSVNVQVRFAHEMNGDWFTWGQQPVAYKAAFQRVTNRVRAIASNTTFIFCLNVGFNSPPYVDYYPGNAFVDILSLDGYNFGDVQPNGSIINPQSAQQVFATSYDEIAALNSTKPITINETASYEYSGKPAWITDLYNSAIPNRMPRIGTVTWFDLDKERDWRINSSPESLTAYRNAVNGVVPPTPAVTTFDFTGTNGSAWPSPWNSKYGGSGAMTISGNRGRLTKSAATYSPGWAVYGTSGTSHVFSKLEFTCKMFMQNIAGESAEVRFRGDGGYDNCYYLLWKPDRTFDLNKRVAATNTTLSNTGSTVKSATVAQNVKLRAEGTTLSYKVWADGTTEPTAWEKSIQDSTFAQGDIEFLYNNANATADFMEFDDISITDLTIDTTGPTVSLTTATTAEYAALSGVATLTATATDAGGMNRVEFLVDNALVGTDSNIADSTFSVNWTTTTATNGDHTVTARAVDAAGNVSTSTTTIKVNNGGRWIVNPSGAPRPATLKVGI